MIEEKQKAAMAKAEENRKKHMTDLFYAK